LVRMGVAELVVKEEVKPKQTRAKKTKWVI
jgi:hypothetical protein